MGITLAQIITWAVAAMIALVTGGVGTAAVQGWLQRNTNRAEAARQTAEEEKARQDAKKAEMERLKLLQEVEATAHNTAEAAAKREYQALERDYTRVEGRCADCMAALNAMRRRDLRRDRIEDAMLDAMVEVVPLLPADAEQTAALRAAIRAARQARYELDDE
jgi:hypothetical protein